MYDSTVLAPYMREVMSADVIKAFASARDLLSIHTVEPYEGAMNKQWPIKSAFGGPATVTPEGAGPPAPTWGTVARANITYQTVQAQLELSGEVISALQPNGIRKAVDEALEDGMTQLMVMVEALAAADLQATISATGNVYGLPRVANNLLPAIQNAAGAALTETHLRNAYEALRLGFRRAEMSDLVILSGVPQQTNYTDFVGIGPAATMPVEFKLSVGDTEYDIGRLRNKPSYNRRPWLDVESLFNGATTDDVYLVHASKLKMIWKRPPMIKALGPFGLPDNYLVAAEVGFYYDDPGKAARITNLA